MRGDVGVAFENLGTFRSIRFDPIRLASPRQAHFPAPKKPCPPDGIHGGFGGFLGNCKVAERTGAHVPGNSVNAVPVIAFRQPMCYGWRMQTILEIPDDLGTVLKKKFGNIGHAALEAFAAEAYRQGSLSCDQVRRLLALESRWQAEAVLSRHGVWPGGSVREALSDMATLDEFLDSRQ